MEFRLLGPVEVVHDGQRLPIGGSKPRTVLAALLLADGRPVSENRLSAALWDSRPPTTRRAQIHTYVSRLRKLLTPYGADVLRTRHGYALRAPTGTLDLTEFRRLVQMGHEDVRFERHASASSHIAAALAMWRGPALGGTTDTFLEEERPRLEEARLAALEERITADLAQGRHSQVLTELDALVDKHPLRERLRAQLMTALYRCGRQAEALEVYQSGRDELLTVGARPGPVLDHVFHAILRADPVLEARPTGPAAPVLTGRQPVGTPSLLPPDLADFAGRAGQVDRLEARLRSAGPGTLVISGGVGVGKSALAVRLAHRCSDVFPDGRLYVDLTMMPPGRERVRAALGRLIEALAPERALPDSVEELSAVYRTSLTGRRILVLIDTAADEAQVRPLLPGPGPARTLVTSRARLAALGDTYRTDLAGFNLREAVELLGLIVGERRIAAEREAAQRLVALCEYLPAAVRAAGARLAARPHWTLGRLATRLADPTRNRLDELCVGDLDLRQRLAEACAQLSAASQQTLTRLALLCSPRISLREAARALRLPERAAEDVLEALVEVHALDFVAGCRPGDAWYSVPGFLGLHLREQHAGRDRTETPALPRALHFRTA